MSGSLCHGPVSENQARLSIVRTRPICHVMIHTRSEKKRCTCLGRCSSRMNMRPLCGDAAAAVILGGAALWVHTSVERRTDKCCCTSVEGRWINGNSYAQEKRAKRSKKKVFLLLHLPLLLLDTTTQAHTKHIDFCLRQEKVAPVSVVCKICLCHRC